MRPGSDFVGGICGCYRLFRHEHLDLDRYRGAIQLSIELTWIVLQGMPHFAHSLSKSRPFLFVGEYEPSASPSRTKNGCTQRLRSRKSPPSSYLSLFHAFRSWRGVSYSNAVLKYRSARPGSTVVILPLTLPASRRAVQTLAPELIPTSSPKSWPSRRSGSQARPPPGRSGLLGSLGSRGS